MYKHTCFEGARELCAENSAIVFSEKLLLFCTTYYEHVTAVVVYKSGDHDFLTPGKSGRDDKTKKRHSRITCYTPPLNTSEKEKKRKQKKKSRAFDDTLFRAPPRDGGPLSLMHLQRTTTTTPKVGGKPCTAPTVCDFSAPPAKQAT